MVGHLLTPALSSSLNTTVTAVTSGGFSRSSDKLAREYAAQQPAELLRLLRHHAFDVWAPPSQGPAAPLTDVIVHTQDIVRPLGIEVVVPPDEIDPSLTFCVSPRSNQRFVHQRRLKGLRFEATDLKWKFGKGEVIEGPAIEILLGVLGRRGSLAELSGPGVAQLATRI